MTGIYPRKLGKDPLVEVVFEVRLEPDKTSLSAILPGVLKAEFKNEIKEIKQLPASNIPRPVRDSQESLRYQPLVQVEREKFLIGISDCSIVLMCKEPYVGWGEFKEEITKMVSILKENTNQRVVRYSLKYINFLAEPLVERKLSSLNVQLRIDGRNINEDGSFIRVTNDEGQFLTIITIASDVKVNNKNNKGIIVDLDVIKNIDIPINLLCESVSDSIDTLHDEVKRRFFGILKKETLNRLEPSDE